jgi:hypothetical protein
MLQFEYIDHLIEFCKINCSENIQAIVNMNNKNIFESDAIKQLYLINCNNNTNDHHGQILINNIDKKFANQTLIEKMNDYLLNEIQILPHNFIWLLYNDDNDNNNKIIKTYDNKYYLNNATFYSYGDLKINNNYVVSNKNKYNHDTINYIVNDLRYEKEKTYHRLINDKIIKMNIMIKTNNNYYLYFNNSNNNNYTLDVKLNSNATNNFKWIIYENSIYKYIKSKINQYLNEDNDNNGNHLSAINDTLGLANRYKIGLKKISNFYINCNDNYLMVNNKYIIYHNNQIIVTDDDRIINDNNKFKIEII